MSMMLQHGVPLASLTAKLRHTRYPPNGYTKDPEVRSCSSPLDLLAQWLELKFLGKPTTGDVSSPVLDDVPTEPK